MTELSDDVIAFLSEGTRTAKVGYLAADGRPLVAPVWFVVDDGQIVFNTGGDTAKGRALVRDPRITVCVDDERPPFSFVQIQGTATLGEEFGRRNGVPGELIVRLTPAKVVAAFNLAD
jgi:PPOX class probable F420-dependent enzyme